MTGACALTVSDERVPVEWQDTGLRANQILTMLAAILIDRSGGRVTITRSEWTELNARFGNQAAVLFSDPQTGQPIEAWIDTIAGASNITSEGRVN